VLGSLTNFTLSYQGQAPTVVNSSVGALNAVPLFGATNTPITSVFVCFVEGTLIRTARGEVPVEELRIGELVICARGEHRPIKWIGYREIDCGRHPDPHLAMPVRIVANAFGTNLPRSDLFVSPGHAICVSVVDQFLIPASALINGASIAQIEVPTVAYWHVELDTHDIIFANGMPTESYVDVGNREFFRNGTGEVDAQAPSATLADYCRPFVSEGSVVDIVRDRLLQRAFALGWALEVAPSISMRMEVDGQIIEPSISGMTATFLVPAPKEVWLTSATSVPAGTGDTRSLGAYICGLEVDKNFSAPHAIPLDDPRLTVGFFAVEKTGETLSRWTGARACLPSTLWDGLTGAFSLRIELAGVGLPLWKAPEGEKVHVPAPCRLRLVQAA
jgi:hypothetical protein